VFPPFFIYKQVPTPDSPHAGPIHRSRDWRYHYRIFWIPCHLLVSFSSWLLCALSHSPLSSRNPSSYCRGWNHSPLWTRPSYCRSVTRKTLLATRKKLGNLPGSQNYSWVHPLPSPLSFWKRRLCNPLFRRDSLHHLEHGNVFDDGAFPAAFRAIESSSGTDFLAQWSGVCFGIVSYGKNPR